MSQTKVEILSECLKGAFISKLFLVFISSSIVLVTSSFC